MTLDQPEFINILEDPDPTEFATHGYRTYKQSHFPTVAETASHLKLLKAFQVYKAKIVGTSPTEFHVKTWQIFISNAIKRFIVFISALKKFHNIDEYYKQKLPDYDYLPLIPSYRLNKDDLTKYYSRMELFFYLVGKHDTTTWARKFKVWLPPLDVIMVWHSFLLNPKTFYDVCMRNKFIQFAMFPFPLMELNKAIDNITFEYAPTNKQMKTYETIISQFSSIPDDLIYHIHSFAMFEQLVTVYCPQCQYALATVPWTNDANSGFGDERFSASVIKLSCVCYQENVITHDSLRKRQLIADYKSNLPMPGVFKYFSHVVSKPKLQKQDPIQFSNTLKYNLETVLTKIDKKKGTNTQNSESLAEFIKSILPKYLNRPSKLILRNYLTMNLIHLTVPHGFQVWEDLVGCCLRQERFIEKMNNLDWLNSPVIKEGLSESIIRYSRFLSLLSLSSPQKMLVPTLDIDLVWHTHQLSMVYYFKHCLTESKGVLDHDDKVEEGRLDDSFQMTAKLYRSKFKQDYSICFCWYCVAIRNKSSSSMTKLFKKSKLDESNYHKHPLYLNKVGLTHISLHNSIELPSLFAERKRKQQGMKYQGKDLPWKEESRIYSWGSYPGIYVVPPFFPIAPSCTDFYNDGLCCTQDSIGTVNCGTGAGCSSGGIGSSCSGGSGSCGSANGGACSSGGGSSGGGDGGGDGGGGGCGGCGGCGGD